MAEKSLEEVRAWKADAAKELEGLTSAEIVKKIQERAEAYSRRHGLDLKTIESASPERTTMQIPNALVDQVQKLIDEYLHKKTG